MLSKNMAKIAGASDRTNAKRQAALRERRRLAGLIQLTVWIHPSNRAKLRRIAKQLETPAKNEKDEK